MLIRLIKLLCNKRIIPRHLKDYVITPESWNLSIHLKKKTLKDKKKKEYTMKGREKLIN